MGTVVDHFTPLSKLTRAEEVAQQLTKVIMDGNYKPGEKFPSEMALAKQFQVSRVSVREALTKLHNAGLITTKRGIHAGTYVTAPSPMPITRSIRNIVQFERLKFVHLIEARLYVEPESARAAAFYRTDEDVQRIRKLILKAQETTKISYKKARQINFAFHCEIARIADNPIILNIIQAIYDVYSSILIEKTKIDKRTILENNNQHQAILDAIEKGDKDDAWEKTRQHIIGTYRTYKKIIEDADDTGIERNISEIFCRSLNKPSDISGLK